MVSRDANVCLSIKRLPTAEPSFPKLSSLDRPALQAQQLSLLDQGDGQPQPKRQRTEVAPDPAGVPGLVCCLCRFLTAAKLEFNTHMNKEHNKFGDTEHYKRYSCVRWGTK